MGSGHFSASDRYKYIKETAFEYSFILHHIDATKLI
jgi:protease II